MHEGGDARVEEGVSHAADDGEGVAPIQIARVCDAGEEHGVQRTADERRELPAELIRERTCHGEGDEPTQTDGDDDGDDRGYVVQPVRSRDCAPERRKLLLIVPHDR